MKKITILLTLLIVISVGFLSGCNEQVTKEEAPIIKFFTATPSIIVLGNSSVLNWSIDKATSVSIDNGIGNVTLIGPYTVVPEESKNYTYTLTATNLYGTNTKSIILYVIMPNQNIIENTTCQNRGFQLGSRACSDDKNYQICGYYNGSECLDWGPMIPCSECIMGNCIDIYSPAQDTQFWSILLTYTGYEDINRTIHLKNLLLNGGWQEDHIRTLAGEDATYNNLLEALEWLRDNSDSNDVIFLSLNAHGNEGYMALTDNSLAYSKLAEELNTVKYGGMVIIPNACFGASSIPFLEKENRVIMWSQEGMSTLWDALSGFGDLRGDNNDWVSAEEIYMMKNFYCTKNNLTSIIYDDYPGELNLLNLNGYWRYLDQYNSNDSLFTSGYGCSVGAIKEKTDTWVAQGFIPNLPILTKVSLNVIKHGNPGPLTLSIGDNLSGSDLTNITIQESHFLPEIEELTDFDFPDIDVVPGNTYYIIVKAPQAIQNNGDFNYYTITASHSTNQSDDHYTHGDLFRMNDPFQTHGFYYTDLEFYTLGKLN